MINDTMWYTDLYEMITVHLMVMKKIKTKWLVD